MKPALFRSRCLGYVERLMVSVVVAGAAEDARSEAACEFFLRILFSVPRRVLTREEAMFENTASQFALPNRNRANVLGGGLEF